MTQARLRKLMQAISASAPKGRDFRAFLVGGSTAILEAWRAASIDVGLHVSDDQLLRDIQRIKEQLDINVELVRPEDFVPPLGGTPRRHVFLERIRRVDWFHYDPYAQVLAKLARGFERDLEDARSFVAGGLVEPGRLVELVSRIPDASYRRYPQYTRSALESAVRIGLEGMGGS